VSLLAGATPGMHFPSSRFYVRRVRFSNTSPLLAAIRLAGYPVEPSVTQRETTSVVEFPVDAGAGIRTEKEVGMWEQLSFSAFLQKHWSDNQVSCTVTFDPATEGPQLEAALAYFQYALKGVSFLPRLAEGAYAQMPIEAIEEADYRRRVAALTLPLRFDAQRSESPIIDRFCDSDTCQQTTVPTCEVKTATGSSAISAVPSADAAAGTTSDAATKPEL
jgi:ribonucleoside-triphosphate reductase